MSNTNANTDRLVQEGEAVIRNLEATGALPPTPVPPVQMRVSCGANTVTLEGMKGYTVSQVKERMQEILNVSDDHRIVLINGRELDMARGYILEGTEDLEFKKPAGNKG